MSNPNQPPKVGFPQAYGTGPYQPVQQFPQYQTSGQPSQSNNAYNGYSGANNGGPLFPPPDPSGPQFKPPQQLGQTTLQQPQSFPSAFKPVQSSLLNNGFPQPNGTPTSMPAAFVHTTPSIPQPANNFSTPNNGTYTPQPLASFPQPSIRSTPISQFPPPGNLGNLAKTAQSPNGPVMPNALPSYPSQQNIPNPPSVQGAQRPTFAPSLPNQIPSGSAVPQPGQPTAPVTYPQTNYPAAPQPFPQQGVQYPAQSFGPQYGGHGMSNLQQNFGQMNMSGQYQPSGYGQLSDIVDLMSYKNQGGALPDIPIKLNQNMANSKARVDPSIFRCTLNAVPCNDELLKKSRLPFGLTLHPFRDMKNLNIIQTSTIVRCRYCRTYINPFVHFPDTRHWKCNICNRQNDRKKSLTFYGFSVSDDFCWDPATKSFGDPAGRPEIKNATVEFIAPAEYMLRPPQPAVYVFILDVSTAAIESGYLYAFTEQILINLDQLPGDDRAQIAFIAVDSCVHFFQFEENSPPRQLIVDDVNEMYLPTNAGLLANIKKQKDSIRNFVKQLPIIFEKPTSSSNCLGAALGVVKELIFEIGGRVTVFQCTLPNLGPGALKSREDPNQRSGKDVQNLGPATDFYKLLALECTGQQIALDLFMLNTQYADLASISEIAKFSTGCVYHFPNYQCFDMIQVKRFEKIFTRYLTRKIGFEAVLRIRCSRGLALSAFYGNFFVRSTDLLACANVNPDSAIAVQVNMEEKLGANVVFQVALLYTSSKGDRRIRVHTMCLPTTSDLNEIYNSFDLKATVSLLCKIGVERSMSGSPLSDSREAVVNAVVDSLGAYKAAIGSGRGMMPVPMNGHLRHFPVYALAMLKHTSLCSGGRSIKLDDRIASMLMLRFAPLEQILSDIHPNLYRLNEITNMAEGEYPFPLPLSFEHIHRDGVYVMEAGTALYIYVSSGADPNFIMEVFGCSYQDVEKSSFEDRGNPTSEKVQAFIRYITTLKFYLGPPIILKEDSPLREVFVHRLVEDRTESTHSYIEFIQHIKREMSQ